MVKRIFIYLGVLLLGVFGCDSERFLKYNYEAERLARQAEISGRVINKFTARAVENATISVERQRTVSDNFGRYRMFYELSADAEQGRAIAIRVEAENYFALDTAEVIFPEPLEINFNLEYAAPIIEEGVVVPGEGVSQALIRDYQGIDNLGSVVVRFHYRDATTGHTYKTADIAMTYRGEAAAYLYRFQAAIPQDYPITDKGDFIIITVLDNDGFSDEFRHTNDPKTPDALLFPTGGGGS